MSPTPSLLETLRKDAEQLVESELPTLNELRPLVAALIGRLEGHLPELAKQSLAALTGVEPEPATKAAEPTAGAAADGAAASASAAAAADSPIASAPAAAPAEATSPSVRALEAQRDSLDAERRQLDAQLDAARAQAPQVSS